MHFTETMQNRKVARAVRAVLAGGAVAALGLTSLAYADDQPATQTSAESPQLEEIVVTASKRQQPLKEVPGAVQAITGAILDKLAIVNFQDYLPYVTGLSGNIGIRPGTYTVILRGLYGGSAQSTPTVGYYLNNLPLTPSSSASNFGNTAPDPDLGDVERIEVLKGPQSTLYGASELGGLIKIVYKTPNLESFGGYGSAGPISVSGDTGYNVDGGVNIPLIPGQLAVRASAYDRQDPGYTDNVSAIRGENNSNIDHAHGGRVDLHYKPTSKLSFDLSGIIQNLVGEGLTATDLNYKTLTPVYGYNKYSRIYNQLTYTQLNLFDFETNYETGIGTLTNSLGFARDDISYKFNDDNSLDFFIPFVTPINDPNAGLVGQFVPPIESKKTTDELRFNSIRLGNFVWQAGAFYTHESVAFAGTIDLVSNPAGTPYPASPAYDNFFFGGTFGTYNEYAGYGDVTYYITDNLDITGGVRYSRNYQHEISELNGPFAFKAKLVTPSFNGSDTSYLFDMRWRPTQNLSTYIRAASAYRPGGPNPLVPSAIAQGVPVSFGPDALWNYEVGAKGRWLGGRLSSNVALYFIDWRNMQLPLTLDNFGFNTNAGEATSKGVEYDGTFEVLPGLILGVNAAYNQAFLKFVAAKNTAGALAGDPLPYAPKWGGSLTGDYTRSLTASLSGGIGASWLYHGSQYTSFTDPPGSGLNPRLQLASYATFSLRGHVDWSRYSVMLNIDNVANKEAYAAILDNGPRPEQTFGTPILPRTYRLTLNASF